MATISYQPWYVGQTYGYWRLPLANDGATEDLTNVNISTFVLYFRTLNGAETAGTGVFSAGDDSSYVLYKPSVADVAAAFTGTVFIVGYYPPGNNTTDEVVFDPIAFTIKVRGSL